MIIRVRHETSYHYEQPVRRSVQTLRISPPNNARQAVIHWKLDLPAPARAWTDGFGNLCHTLVLDQPHDSILICAQGVVDVRDGDIGEAIGPMPLEVFLRPTALTLIDPAIHEFASPMEHTMRTRPFMGLHDLMLALIDRMPYASGHTAVGDTAAQAFATGRGVCQDHTHVFLACARSLGLAARYVSGYILSNDQGHVASHAWAEVWIGERWVGFDVSNSRSAGAEHIRLAQGMDYADTCPVRGVRTGGGTESMHSYAQVESQLSSQQ